MGADGALISIPLGIFFMWDEQKKQHYPHHPHLKRPKCIACNPECKSWSAD